MWFFQTDFFKNIFEFCDSINNAVAYRMYCICMHDSFGAILFCWNHPVWHESEKNWILKNVIAFCPKDLFFFTLKRQLKWTLLYIPTPLSTSSYLWFSYIFYYNLNCFKKNYITRLKLTCNVNKCPRWSSVLMAFADFSGWHVARVFSRSRQQEANKSSDFNFDFRRPNKIKPYFRV